MIKYTDFLLEHKLWYKSINQFLNWIESKSVNDWIFIDTETTGLGGHKKQQLTQVSAISNTYNFNSNDFTEKNSFNKKIKLTDETKVKMNEPGSRIKKVLSFNHYGTKDTKYYDEQMVLDEFYGWIDEQNNPLFVIQNAAFDMNMLNGRYGRKYEKEVIDTKQIIQLYYIPLIQKLAETDEDYKKMIETIGTSERDFGLISSSMSKIGPALNISMINYHDALTDCRIMTDMFIKIINILKENKDIDIMKYQTERIKTLK